MIAAAPWNEPSVYNFTSSEFGGVAVKIVAFILIVVVGRWLWKKVKKHFECHVDSCEAWGYPVHGTSFRACKPHHPHIDEKGHTVEEIQQAAKEGHNADT
jgi:ABC-type nickel/cobalt efflux system permease component RcnA